MEKRLPWDYMARQMLVLGMWGMVYHCIVCILYNVISRKTMQMDLMLLVLYIPLCIFALIRSKCSNFFVFLLSHLAVSGIFVVLLDGCEQKIIMSVCMFVMIAASFMDRLKPHYARGQGPSAGCVFLFLAVYGAAYVLKRPAVMQISYYEAFLFLILFVIHKSLCNTSKFLKQNEGMKNMPSGEIKGMSRMLLAAFLLFFIAGMILLQNMPVGELLTAVGGVLKNVLRSIFLLVIQLLSGGEEAVEKVQSVGQESLLPIEAGEASAFLKVLEQVIMSLIYIGLAAAAVYLAARVFYAVYKRFYAQQHNHGDESEFLWQRPLAKEHVSFIKRKKEHWEGGSSGQKIRHMYKKYIRRAAGKKTVISMACTPWELENSIKTGRKQGDGIKTEEEPEYGKKADYMAEHGIRMDDTVKNDIMPAAYERIRLYEKARYGNCECTKQDVEEMKRYLKF